VSKGGVSWKQKPDRSDLESAHRYLRLLDRDGNARALVQALRAAKTVEHAAKDLLRATSLPLLARDESKVQADLKRIRKGRSLSPVLLVQGDLTHAVPLTVADGYHRICAVYYYDEDALIACRLVRR
jgi:hypothetical protein